LLAQITQTQTPGPTYGAHLLSCMLMVDLTRHKSTFQQRFTLWIIRQFSSVVTVTVQIFWVPAAQLHYTHIFDYSKHTLPMVKEIVFLNSLIWADVCPLQIVNSQYLI